MPGDLFLNDFGLKFSQSVQKGCKRRCTAVQRFSKKKNLRGVNFHRHPAECGLNNFLVPFCITVLMSDTRVLVYEQKVNTVQYCFHIFV